MKNSHRKTPLKSRKDRYFVLENVNLKSSFRPSKTLSFLRSVKLKSSAIFALLYMNILYVHIWNVLYAYIWIFYTYIPIFLLPSFSLWLFGHPKHLHPILPPIIFISWSSQGRNIINVISHLKISAGFQFNRSGLANKRTEFIIFFPICTTKTIQIQFFWIVGRRRGCWKKRMKRKTHLYMLFTYITEFHTPHIHAKKAGNLQRIIAE